MLQINSVKFISCPVLSVKTSTAWRLNHFVKVAQVTDLKVGWLSHTSCLINPTSTDAQLLLLNSPGWHLAPFLGFSLMGSELWPLADSAVNKLINTFFGGYLRKQWFFLHRPSVAPTSINKEPPPGSLKHSEHQMHQVLLTDVTPHGALNLGFTLIDLNLKIPNITEATIRRSHR